MPGGKSCRSIFKRGGESQNLSNPEVEAKLSDLIPHAHLVHFAPPCSTFSTIMFLNKWSSRTVEYPLGGGVKQGLTRATDPREIEANKILDCCCRLAKICDTFGVPWTWENPARSLMWKTPQLLSLLATHHTTAHVDWCAYGLPWKKAPTSKVVEFHGSSSLSVTATNSTNTRS